MVRVKTTPEKPFDSERVHEPLSKPAETPNRKAKLGAVRSNSVRRHRDAEVPKDNEPYKASEIPENYNEITANHPEDRSINVLVELPNVKTKVSRL